MLFTVLITLITMLPSYSKEIREWYKLYQELKKKNKSKK